MIRSLSRCQSSSDTDTRVCLHMFSQDATDHVSSFGDASTPFSSRGQQGRPPWKLADQTAPSHYASLGHGEAEQQSSLQQRGKVSRDHAIVASAVLADGTAPVSLPQAVAELFPHHFPTATSAKRACRRGEILVDGIVSKLKYQRYTPVGYCMASSWLHAIVPPVMGVCDLL